MMVVVAWQVRTLGIILTIIKRHSQSSYNIWKVMDHVAHSISVPDLFYYGSRDLVMKRRSIIGNQRQMSLRFTQNVLVALKVVGRGFLRQQFKINSLSHGIHTHSIRVICKAQR